MTTETPDVVIVEQRAVSLNGRRWLHVAALQQRNGRTVIVLRPMRSQPVMTPSGDARSRPASSDAIPAVADGEALELAPHALPDLVRALEAIASRLGLRL